MDRSTMCQLEEKKVILMIEIQTIVDLL